MSICLEEHGAEVYRFDDEYAYDVIIQMWTSFHVRALQDFGENPRNFANVLEILRMSFGTSARARWPFCSICCLFQDASVYVNHTENHCMAYNGWRIGACQDQMDYVCMLPGGEVKRH